jgi:hypothetical protein
MNNAKAQKHVAEVDQSIIKAEAIVSAQERRIRRLAAGGLPTAQAEKNLKKFEKFGACLAKLPRAVGKAF